MKKICLVFSLLFSLSLNAQWIQKGLDIDGEADNDDSGISVSMSADGNTLAIGASSNDGTTGANWNDRGHVRIYEWNGTSWNQKGLDIDGESTGDGSGRSVSMSADGNTLAIGASSNDGNGLNSGHVRVYDWNGTIWTQKGVDIDGDAADDRSYVVSMSDDGNTLAIGAENNDGATGNLNDNRGHVRIYEWNGTSWNQKGLDIDGENAGDKSGRSVSMSADGNTVAIGAHLNDWVGSNSGHVRIYEWNGTTWNQKGQDINGEAHDDNSGTSISMSADGNCVAIGAPNNDGNGYDRGHVRVYNWDGTTWIQKGVDIDGEADDDRSGYSVSMSADGNNLAIGAYQNDGTTGNINDNRGHVRIYKWNGTSWNQKGQDIDGEAAYDKSGVSVSICADGDTLAIGAYQNDGAGGVDVGHVRVYDFCIETSSVDVHYACDTFTWIDGNTYTASNNSATDTLINALGCDSIVTLDLTIYSASVDAGNDQTICFGCGVPDDSIALSASGAQTYAWDNGVTDGVYFTPSATALYTVTGTDANRCTATDSVTVFVGNRDCASFTLTGLDSIVYNNQTYYQSGLDTVIYTNVSGCDSIEYLDIIINHTGINENIFKDVEVYPNPTSDIITLKGISSLSDVSYIHLLDNKGALLRKIGINETHVDLSSFSTGIYFIEIKHQLGSGRIKVIKQ